MAYVSYAQNENVVRNNLILISEGGIQNFTPLNVAGVMFDVTANSDQDIHIHRFDQRLNPVNNADVYNVYVYYNEKSYKNREDKKNSWNLVSTSTVTVSKSSFSTVIELEQVLPVAAGTTRGVYIAFASASDNSDDGNVVQLNEISYVYSESNSHISIDGGTSLSALFEGGGDFSAAWIGSLYYTFGAFPTAAPSEKPTKSPTKRPTISPTKGDTILPSFVPTLNPNKQTSLDPTLHPMISPSIPPSNLPSPIPHNQPSNLPSISGSSSPYFSVLPSNMPSLRLSEKPTDYPIINPTFEPSTSAHPSDSKNPTTRPSVSSQPSIRPPTVNPPRASSNDNDSTIIIASLTAVSSIAFIIMWVIFKKRKNVNGDSGGQLLRSPLASSILSPFSYRNTDNPPEIFDDESSAAVSHNMFIDDNSAGLPRPFQPGSMHPSDEYTSSVRHISMSDFDTSVDDQFLFTERNEKINN